MLGEEAVVVHAGHVLLDERLDELLQGLLVGELSDKVVLEQLVGLVAIDCRGLGAVELKQQIALDQLIDAGIVAEGPGLLPLIVKQVVAKGEIRFLITKQMQQGRGDVGLLCDSGGVMRWLYRSVWRIEDDGDAV